MYKTELKPYTYAGVGPASGAAGEAQPAESRNGGVRKAIQGKFSSAVFDVALTQQPKP